MTDTPTSPRRRAWRRPRLRRRRSRGASAGRGAIWNLPNALTMGRIAAIPLVMWLLAQSDVALAGEGSARLAVFYATLVFTAASITDFLDGWLARKLGLMSAFGRFLDPLADKLLVLACLLELVALDRVPTWLAALLLSREVAITGLRAIASEEGVNLPSDRFGKWKTAMQMAGLIGLLLHFEVLTDFGFGAVSIRYHHVGLALLVASMAFSLLSAFGYLRSFVMSTTAPVGSPGG